MKAKEYRDRPIEYARMARECIGPVVDVGCCFGEFMKYLPPQCQCIGMDISAVFIGAARKRHPGGVFLHADVLVAAPYFGGAFATAVCGQLLEHFTDPTRLLDALAFISRDRLVFTVPRGSVAPGSKTNDGHLRVWVNEDDVAREFASYGDIVFIPRDEIHGGHIGGVLTWSVQARRGAVSRVLTSKGGGAALVPPGAFPAGK